VWTGIPASPATFGHIAHRGRGRRPAAHRRLIHPREDKFMNRRILLGLLISSSAATVSVLAGPPAITSPRDIVVEIYRISAGADGKYHGPSAFNDTGVRNRYFSRSLLTAVVKMEKLSRKTNEPILDFDPVTSSQDPDVKALQITVESETAAKVVVAVRFLSFDDTEPSIVRYDLIQERNGWKIDDMRGEHGKDAWSLRDIIK
jgi:hypothetical protein